MANRMSRSELFRANELQALGIWLDGGVLEKMQAAYRGLCLEQDPAALYTCVYDLGDRGTGYVISIMIRNESERAIRGMIAPLQLPWCEANFHWLKLSRGQAYREHTYDFPDPGPSGFEYETVLNHRLGVRSYLFPGDPLEGYLLGVGSAPIPAEFRNQPFLQARLSIFEGRDKSCSLEIQLQMDRSRPRGSRHQEKTQRTRKGLFEGVSESWAKKRAA
jgi:hypothetical protein